MKNLKDYSILILAAGKGRRLKNIGKKSPKCLVQISNKTLIEILIENLKRYGAKEVNIVLGYKKELILKKIETIKDIKFNPIVIKNYDKNGHGMSWFSFKNKWNKKKKPLFIFHADIIFDHRFIQRLLLSKKKDLIGVKNKNRRKYKPKSIAVESNHLGVISKIDYLNNTINPKGEILGINKFSINTTEKIFNFMSKFLKGNNKTLSWEFVIDRFITLTKTRLYMLFNQNFYWVNINTIKDLIDAKKVYKRSID